MKTLLFDTGGRPRANDDLQTLQSELSYAITSQLLGLPACVVTGCEVASAGTNLYNVGPGMVYLNGQLLRFDGVSSVALPLELYEGPEEQTDFRPYQTGGSKACMSERKALTRAVGGTGATVLITTTGVLTLAKAREALFRTPFEVGMVADFPDEYDGTGKGKYGTAAYGWALCNGQNRTPDMGGRVAVGYASGSADYGNTRKTGGVEKVALTAAQNAPHDHTMEQAGNHTHQFNNWQLNFKADRSDSGSREYVPDPGIRNTSFTTASAGSHIHTINVSGEGQAHENRQPYTVLAYRMWIGF